MTETGFLFILYLFGVCVSWCTVMLMGYIESAEQSRTAEHFWLAAYSVSKSDNKPV